MDYLIQSGVTELHKIAHLDLSRTTDERKQFLRTPFANVPEILTTKSIVDCKYGHAKPSTSNFPVDRYLNTHVVGLTSEIYDLLVQRFEKVPIAFTEWESIINDWEELGYNSLSKYSLETTIGELPDFLLNKSLEKKRDFINSVLNALLLARNYTKSLPNGIRASGILLNQSSALVAPKDANIDFGVDDELKDFATKLGWSIKDQLIDGAIMNDERVKDFIHADLCAGGDKYDSQFVAKKLWESYVSSKWKENANKTEKTEFRKALLQFVIWLALKIGEDTKNIVDPKLLPILCGDNKFRSCSEMQAYPLLWPDSTWKESLKRHKDLFNPHIMSESYLDLKEKEDCKKLLDVLKKLDVAKPDVFIKWKEKGLSPDEATAVGVNSSFTARASVPNCSDVIGLQDMTSAAVGDKDIKRASKVMDFILRYVIEVDTSWNTPITLAQSKQLYPSYWLAVLKTKDWIPSSDPKHSKKLIENQNRAFKTEPIFRL